MVERSLRMREARGSIPRVSSFYFFTKPRVAIWLRLLGRVPHSRAGLVQFPGFLESLWRDVDMNRLNHHPSDDLDLIIVSHGLASRVFLMKWFKWTVEQFELLNNFGNGEFRVIQLGVVEIGEYSLAVHHTDEELLEWGLSPDMVADQKRRASAGKGDWNDQYSWYLDAFFYHLPDSDDDNVDKHDETDSLSECS
ncbi:hypothetical protein AAZX31_03G220500 [Glycine max]